MRGRESGVSESRRVVMVLRVNACMSLPVYFIIIFSNLGKEEKKILIADSTLIHLTLTFHYLSALSYNLILYTFKLSTQNGICELV